MVMEDALLKGSPNLAAEDAVNIVSEYDNANSRDMVAALKEKIEYLKTRIADVRVSATLEMILKKILRGKGKLLDKQLDESTQNPTSSDEDGEIKTTRACPHEQLIPKFEIQQEDQLTWTSGGIEKTGQAAKLQAWNVLNSKKNYKNNKEDEDAESRVLDAQLRTTKKTEKPAALMSSPNPQHSAAEVIPMGLQTKPNKTQRTAIINPIPSTSRELDEVEEVWGKTLQQTEWGETKFCKVAEKRLKGPTQEKQTICLQKSPPTLSKPDTSEDVWLVGEFRQGMAHSRLEQTEP